MGLVEGGGAGSLLGIDDSDWDGGWWPGSEPGIPTTAGDKQKTPAPGMDTFIVLIKNI